MIRHIIKRLDKIYKNIELKMSREHTITKLTEIKRQF